MLQAIGAERARLSQWERGFFDDQMKRVEEYGANTHFSPKQWAVVKRMHEKITGEKDEEPPLEDDSRGFERDEDDYE